MNYMIALWTARDREMDARQEEIYRLQRAAAEEAQRTKRAEEAALASSSRSIIDDLRDDWEGEWLDDFF